ncbi:hypothetical protein A3A21_03660 [Candidatus Jorgensenbacteria bacterium RIFCSPLOWO2_01_FULL_45_25b]|uniref:2'-deoxycytidine 5'-triphosphate deaminase n=1 Tax=Candidatus Jorgensenbacteria bacterium RIFCSPLOWO2_01_FULL_45_25b TaxID=1798471 RepID=A0A1F6BYT0_9BACT|nr:MAG: hypothetical protein A3A21_03660 [Candidatus Jorgensenbacteria bacterium RIFCSPLOWO2_01_FULL_45_25b]
MEKQGTLPSQDIRTLIRDGGIVNGNENNVQPASLDLTVGGKIYRLPHIFLPKPEERVEDVAKEIGAEAYTFEYPLEINTLYLVKLKEQLNLPDSVYGYSNPKSSVGRIDLKVSMLADYVARFDAAGHYGYKGELWAIVEPKSFRVKIQPGDTLLQLRLFYSDTRIKNQNVLENFYRKHNPLYFDETPIDYKEMKINDEDGSVIMTVDLRYDLVGWRCEGTQKYIDFSKKKLYKPEDFFAPIHKSPQKTVTLRKGDFYILHTREKIRVPPTYAAEIAPMDVRSGEYRSHYAGFIDPGFGYGKEGRINGQSIVLEVRPFENSIVLSNKQPICKVVFEELCEMPDIVYGEEELGSHYANQTGPRLSKHFVQE